MRHLYKLIPGIQRIAEYTGKYRSLGVFLQRMEEKGETEITLLYTNYVERSERYVHTSVSLETKKGLYHIRKGKRTKETYEEARNRTIKIMSRLAKRLEHQGFSVKIMGQESDEEVLVPEAMPDIAISEEEPSLEAMLVSE